MARLPYLAAAALAVGGVVAAVAVLAGRGDGVAEPLAAPAESALLGTWRGPGPGRPDDWAENLRQAEEQIGRRYAIDYRFYDWGTELPTDYDRRTSDEGRLSMAALSTRDYDTAERVTWRSIAEGEHDDYLESLADGYRDLDAPAIVAFDQEPESEVGTLGTADEYRRAFRRVAEVFRERGATNVSFMWVTSAWSFTRASGRRGLMEEMYPGDDVVDWIGADAYNFFEDGRWRSLADEIRPWYRWATSEHPSVPLALAEWGSKEDPDEPGRKARWLAEALEDVKAEFTALHALISFDEAKRERGTVNDWRIDTSPSALATYRRLANDPYLAANP